MARLVPLVIDMLIGDVVIVGFERMLFVLRWTRADCFARLSVYGLSGSELLWIAVFPILTILGVIVERSHFIIGTGTHADEICHQLLGAA